MLTSAFLSFLFIESQETRLFWRDLCFLISDSTLHRAANIMKLSWWVWFHWVIIVSLSVVDCFCKLQLKFRSPVVLINVNNSLFAPVLHLYYHYFLFLSNLSIPGQSAGMPGTYAGALSMSLSLTADIPPGAGWGWFMGSLDWASLSSDISAPAQSDIDTQAINPAAS